MSSGEFSLSKYEADGGAVHEIKLQPETIFADLGGVSNDPPSTIVNSLFAAEVNRGAKAYGLRPRKVRVSFKDDAPEGYKPYQTLTIPVLTPATFNSIAPGDAVSYNGGTGVVTKKIVENINPGASAFGQDNDDPVTPG